MYCLKLVDGDLSVGLDGRLEIAQFETKLIQQVKTWLLFPYGSSPTAPDFGATLNNLIGELHPNELQDNVLGEVNRILGLYQQDQIERIRRDQDLGALKNWSRREVLAGTQRVDSQAVQDAVIVTGVLQTLADTTQGLDLFLGHEAVA